MRAHPSQQSGRPLRVERVDRLVGRVVVLGVDPIHVHPRRYPGVGHDEPVPASIEGQVPQRPCVARRDGRVVDPVGQDPLCRALEDRELIDVVRDGGADLESTGAGTDEREVGCLGCRGPPASAPSGTKGRRRFPCPRCQGSRGRFSEPTALMTKRASSTSSAPLACRTRDAPHGLVFLPHRLGDSRLEAAVRLEIEFVDDGPEVSAKLGLLAVVLAPELGRFEREAVLMAPDVDACAGVAVLPPRAARASVLVDDREGQPGLLEADAGEDSAHAATDDDHWTRHLLGR